ncbi:hypothetical protein CBL_20651 [Carabus blaptoides fortunei]
MSEEQVYKLKLNSPNKMRPSFHVMKESALPTIKGYIIRKDKLYYEEILEVMGWICQAGLDIYWRNRNYEIEDNTSTRKESFEIDDGYQPINMEHLQPAFILLASGLVLATMGMRWTTMDGELERMQDERGHKNVERICMCVREKFIDNNGRSERELRDKEQSAKSRGKGDREE